MWPVLYHVRLVRVNARVYTYIRGRYVSGCVYQAALMRRSTPKHACLQIVLIYIYYMAETNDAR